jgi:hypothetical protein
MNNPEVTMHEIGNSNRFEVQEKAIRAAGIAIQLALKVPAPLRSIADQIVRSASSVPANLAEGNGRSDATDCTTSGSRSPLPERSTPT